MATHASGMDAHGWAYVISAGKRWATDILKELALMEIHFSLVSKKKINDQHSLNISSFILRVAEENSPK
jgi:hypothetical protein